MKRFSEKVFLQLKMPTGEVPLSDEKRLHLALEALGYENVQIPLAVMRRLYPLCRNAGFDITVTLVRRETDWAMVNVEAGDTTKHHYGLAVDYGSTTIVPQILFGEKRAALYGHVADCVSPSSPAFRFHFLLLHIFLPLYFI